MRPICSNLPYYEQYGSYGGIRRGRARFTVVDAAVASSRSEYMRATEMPRVYLLVFHTALAGVGTGSAMRRYVQLPIAIAPVRCHVPCYALRAAAKCGEFAKRVECVRHRRLGPPVPCRGDSAVDLVALVAVGCY